MASSLLLEVVCDLFADPGLEELECPFNFQGGFFGFPVTLDVEFGIVIGVHGLTTFVPEVAESDVFGETVKGVIECRFGQGLFYAELESVPKELVDAWRG